MISHEKYSEQEQAPVGQHACSPTTTGILVIRAQRIYLFASCTRVELQQRSRLR